MNNVIYCFDASVETYTHYFSWTVHVHRQTVKFSWTWINYWLNYGYGIFMNFTHVTRIEIRFFNKKCCKKKKQYTVILHGNFIQIHPVRFYLVTKGGERARWWVGDMNININTSRFSLNTDLRYQRFRKEIWQNYLSILFFIVLISHVILYSFSVRNVLLYSCFIG